MKTINLLEEPSLIKIDANEWKLVFPQNYDDEIIFDLFE